MEKLSTILPLKPPTLLTPLKYLHHLKPLLFVCIKTK